MIPCCAYGTARQRFLFTYDCVLNLERKNNFLGFTWVFGRKKFPYGTLFLLYIISFDF